MTSINTNIAAQTALRTLQATNSQLDSTQSRISTGLKIGEAKDNAAYWSISTTLKSDSRSLSTVQDALSLGAATVDTAYQGTNQAREVLEEIQNKIILASGNSADKDALQAEIKQLQENLKAIAGSSGFSGENWLSVDPSVAGYTATKSVVSSFNREASGGVTLDTISIAAADFVLINAAADKSGVLDGGKEGNAVTGGLANKAKVDGTVATGGTFTTAAIAASGTANTAFAGAVEINGTDYAFSLTAAGAGNSHTRAEMIAAIQAAETAGGVALSTVATITVNADNTLTITSLATGIAGTAELKITTAGGSNLAAIAQDAGDAFAAAASTTVAAFTDDIELDADDTIKFKIAVDGAAGVDVVIDRATAIAAGATDGKITSATLYATVIEKALANAGLASKVSATANVAGNIVFTSDATSGATDVTITDFATAKGVSILALDVSTADAKTLASYRDTVVSALAKLTDNAATLGAVAKRIELQNSFVSKLIDTIDKGVSGLIDADMNEESTRLQALQVKQQLGVQALSIANQSAQNVLSLFR